MKGNIELNDNTSRREYIIDLLDNAGDGIVYGFIMPLCAHWIDSLRDEQREYDATVTHPDDANNDAGDVADILEHMLAKLDDLDTTVRETY